jgi:hypothetical protein
LLQSTAASPASPPNVAPSPFVCASCALLLASMPDMTPASPSPLNPPFALSLPQPASTTPAVATGSVIQAKKIAIEERIGRRTS